VKTGCENRKLFFAGPKEHTMSDPLYIRRGFGLRKVITPQVDAEYGSTLLARMRENGNRLEDDGVTVLVAEALSFCYGVDRAVDLAYETRARFPDRRLFLTAQIIHNPHVNRRLEAMGIRFLGGDYGRLRPEDVVLIPAFGIPEETLARLRGTGCLLVDTTCGSVINVWRNVERNARDGFTTIIHGKLRHEETCATTSRAIHGGDGHFVVVRDLDEAEVVAATIRGDLGPGPFMAALGPACSPGFDPGLDLARIGLANQTTMLASQSLEIARCLEAAMVARYGGEVGGRFRSFDTICGATEERQQAVLKLVEEERPDLMVVVGGFNSSNTGHLAEIAAGHCATFHIEEAADLRSPDRIRHKPPGERSVEEERPWLPPVPATIGLTAGASTPGVKIGEVVARLFELERGGGD